MNLPKPVGRQRDVLYLPAGGHVVVLGTAGSGKTTLAIHRAAHLADPTTDHCGTTLLVTFNRSLVTYLRFLQGRSLTNVVIEHYHKFARGYLQSRGKMANNAICSTDERKSWIGQAVRVVKGRYPGDPLLNRPVDFFVDEIGWIAQHGLRTFEAYNEAERIGRSDTRIGRGEPRQVMFEVCNEYRSLRAAAEKLYDWDDLATAVLQEFATDSSPRVYRHVVIDEGQDFSPEMLRSLTAAVPTDGSVTFFGDVAQQIYGQRMSWRSAGLRILGVWRFQENYRNSRQIARLALGISAMPYFADVSDLIEPISPAAAGPLPTLVECSSPEAELEFVLDQAAQLASVQSVAILSQRSCG